MVKQILNIVGWIGMAFVAAAIVIRLGFPAQDRYAYYLAWAGLVSVLLYMMSQWREFAALFTRRQAKYGTLTAVSVLVVLGILVAINYIGKRQNKRWDLTSNQQFSLSDQSKQIVQKLDAPLQVRVFAKRPDFQIYRDRLAEYQYASKQVAVEYIDPDEKPVAAKQAAVAEPTIFFDYKGRTEKTTSNTEQDVTNAIIKVVTGEQKKVYFTQGHGEKDPESGDRTVGYQTAAEGLKRENYTVEKLAIMQKPEVPADAAVVVIAGPTIDFLPPEIEALKTYMGKAGKILLALDPPEKLDSRPLTNLVAFAHDWGIDVGNNVVVDVSGVGQLFGAGAAVPIAVSYPPHPLTQRFNVMTAYPLTRSVTAVSGGVNGHNAQDVIQTGRDSWAETDLKDLFASEKVELNPDKGDKEGPVSIAAAVSAPISEPTPEEPPKENAPKPEARLVVVGDSDFAANSTINAAGNRDLFMNTVGWLSQQEDLISVRAKEASDNRLTLTSAQQVNINWISLLGIPVVIFGMGIYTWWRRR